MSRSPLEPTIWDVARAIKLDRMISNCYHVPIAVEQKELSQILVRKLDDDVKSSLRRRAKANGRSMEEEARVIIRDAVLSGTAVKKDGVGTKLAKAFAGKVPKEFRIVEIRGKVRVPDFGK